MKKITLEKAQVTGALIAAHTTFERRHGSFSQRNGKIRAMGVTALAAATFLPALVHAQNNVATPYEAAAAYNAYNQNFLVQSGGLTYYNCELNSVGDNNCGGYGEALSIQVCEDNWDATHSQAAQTLVNSMLTTFDNTQGALWSGDGWNDDVGWMVAAYIHGYWATGNSTWLTIAENNWNLVYNRGWSTQLGGGIYETTDNQDKEGLSNNPFIWEGVQLYEATGDTTYLTKAEAIYAWVRSNLFNATNSNNAVGGPAGSSRARKTAERSKAPAAARACTTKEPSSRRRPIFITSRGTQNTTTTRCWTSTTRWATSRLWPLTRKTAAANGLIGSSGDCMTFATIRTRGPHTIPICWRTPTRPGKSGTT